MSTKRIPPRRAPARKTTNHPARNHGIVLALILMASLVMTALFLCHATPLAADTPSASRLTTTDPPSLPVDAPLPAPLPERLLPTLAPTPTPNLPAPPADIRTYQGKKFRYAKTLTLRVTAYAPDPRCTFPFPGTTTASGLPVTTNGGHLVAADTKLIPLHWLVAVPGYASAAPVPVLDRGSAIQGNRLDILLPTFEKAKTWGARTLQVKIYRPL